MAQPENETTANPRGFNALPTGTKLFLILSAALLPLALIAITAAFQTARSADARLRDDLKNAADQSARALRAELSGDLTALRVVLDAADHERGHAPNCGHLRDVFADQITRGMAFAVTNAQGRRLCATRPVRAIAPATSGAPGAAIVGDDLLLTLAVPSGSRATIALPHDTIAAIARPNGFTPPYESSLRRGDTLLALETFAESASFQRTEPISVPLGIDSLFLEMRFRAAPFSVAMIAAMLLPLVMWAAAAGIVWIVVDRILLLPLRRLRTRAAAFQPGEAIDLGDLGRNATREIRELGGTFRTISETVARHEAGLAEGLLRQTKLTREVHHRVKNNLQVISSLINFHARAATSGEARAAFASIQRRVDALAVVHRHYFAEIEQSRGLQLRSIISELAANLRATAPAHSKLAIALEMEPFLVGQDVAVALSFLITELVELAMTLHGDSDIRLSIHPDTSSERARLRVGSTAFRHERLHEEYTQRYGRVVEGLARQLRSEIRHDIAAGAYELAFAITGCD